MSTHDDEHGSGTGYGRPPQQLGQPTQYGTGERGQPYGARPYGRQGGHDPYAAQAPCGQYGAQAQYGQYGQAAAAARPTPVVVAAVLGFVSSALGGLPGLGLLLGGALVGTVMEDLVASDPALSGVDPDELDEVADVAQRAAIGSGVLALGWTAPMVWGAVRALTGAAACRCRGAARSPWR